MKWWLERRRRRLARRRPASYEPWWRFEVGLVLLATVLLVGTTGYTLIGLSPFDALYQTAITVTTVGYTEVGPPEVIDDTYRAFTLAIVLIGASTVLYIVSVLIDTLVEGRLNDGFRLRRMMKQVDKMEGHLIVAGNGRVGRAIANHATRIGSPTVVVDLVASEDEDPPMVVGDANDDGTLLAAGIERAGSLVAALGTDTENLTLTLTARSLRSDLLIVARVDDPRNERKFLRAGADELVNPHEIGGARMASVALQPHASGFLERVLADGSYDTGLVEVAVLSGSPLEGRTLVDATSGDAALVLALRGTDGGFVANPPLTTRLTAGDTLIVLGSKAQVERLEGR